MDNNRRRLELLNGILFSLPGTPIIYYGDEIGMGDNVYLGDRNGVRTPMQWNSDRNAGFTRANPAMLYSPVIMDPVWGYQALNVEAQDSEPSSLLNWMRNMIALRKLFRVFGRGTLRFLAPSNRKVLAYVRAIDNEQVLCVMNLSRYAQPVDLDLADLAGMRPVEMMGYVEFPVVTREPYRVTLGPYGFFWLEMHAAENDGNLADSEPERAPLAKSWAQAIPEMESSILSVYLPKQRWFGGKSRPIQGVRVTDWAEAGDVALMFLQVTYQSGDPEEYFAPFIIRDGALQDGLLDDSLCTALLKTRELRMQKGVIRGEFFKWEEDADCLQIRRATAEQSNSSIIYVSSSGQDLILKVFRRQDPGPNPEVEIGKRLFENGKFDRVPPYFGALEYRPDEGVGSAIAIVQGMVPNEGDGWAWASGELERFYEQNAHLTPPAPGSDAARDAVGAYLGAARLLGRRTAELHVALSAGEDAAFSPEELTHEDTEIMASQIRSETARTFELLRGSLPVLPDDSLEMAGAALRNRRSILDRLHLPADRNYGKRIRVHGDFHLGQVLRTKNDFVMVDFEGEPARPLAQRRAKHSPLKDVAGMMRSFSYAANSALMNYTARRPEDFASLQPWARLWEVTVAEEFIEAYLAFAEIRKMLPEADEDVFRLLDAYRLEKAMYELRYELNSRPDWVRIPLAGILALDGA